MTQKHDDTDYKAEQEAEIAVATAVPQQGGATGEPPIPPGHARFYCHKCHTPYDLPDKATSWRCSQCMTFNSITPGECEWCTVL